MNSEDSACVRDAAISHINSVGNELYEAAEKFNSFAVAYKLAPFRDGNQWCVLLGGDIQSGIAGFGDSPAKAIADFDRLMRAPVNDCFTTAQPAQPAQAYWSGQGEESHLSQRGLEAARMAVAQVLSGNDDDEVEKSIRAAISAYIAIERPAQAVAVPEGFVAANVKNLNVLVAAIERAASKGYLPDAIADAWEVFDYRMLAASKGGE